MNDALRHGLALIPAVIHDGDEDHVVNAETQRQEDDDGRDGGPWESNP